jgi:hypothetical protein
MECVVEVRNVVDEALRGDIIVMNRNAIKLETVIYQDGWTWRPREAHRAAITSGKEVLHPFLTRGSRGGRGRDKPVTVSLEWLDVLFPEICGMLGGHIGLPRLVRPTDSIALAIKSTWIGGNGI